MYFEKLRELYHEIPLQNLQSVKLNEVDNFELTVRTGFCKCLQINQIIHSRLFDENSFLYLATLRGICEEIITLKFIDKFIKDEDKGPLIISIFKHSTRKELNEQSQFMKKYRPAQPILNERLVNAIPGEEISAILNRNGISGNKIPPTSQMADRIGLKELYDYIYRGACSFVHFNPRIMQRTVWFEEGKIENSEISITNFHKYYFSFSSFYCSYLFGLYFQYFKKYINIDRSSQQIIEEIMELVRNKVHFPELVTFEEFNVERPKTKWTVINPLLENQLFDLEEE